MDSKLELRRKVPDKNDMQNLEGREKEGGREREEEEEGALDVCFGTQWYLQRYGEQGGSSQWKYVRKLML